MSRNDLLIACTAKAVNAAYPDHIDARDRFVAAALFASDKLPLPLIRVEIKADKGFK